MVDAIATTSASLATPDTSSWEDGVIPLDHISRTVFLRFDLSKIQDYSALYGDKWSAKLRIFVGVCFLDYLRLTIFSKGKGIDAPYHYALCAKMYSFASLSTKEGETQSE
jgi:hypothetical protein